MYVCTISTLFVVVVVCMYVQESPVCIFYPIVWYIHMVLTAIQGAHNSWRYDLSDHSALLSLFPVLRGYAPGVHK